MDSFNNGVFKKMTVYLDFEQAVIELESKIAELKHVSSGGHINIVDEIATLQQKADKQLQSIYNKLTPWQKVQVARHPERPHTKHYIEQLFQDFVPLAGDRLFAEDHAILSGFATFRGRSVLVMGHEKGLEVEERIRHNFGMAKPEGYRKAQRLMQLAEKFSLPVINLVDTAGASPVAESEERGQGEAIAKCLEVALNLTVPSLSVIIGEGGSGGAVALAATNEVMMLEHSIYSVISPEGCASILWRSATKKEDAAEAQKLTAQDLLKFKVIERIIPEPLGGAHRNQNQTIANVGQALEQSLKTLSSLSPDQIRKHRFDRFLSVGRSL